MRQLSSRQKRIRLAYGSLAFGMATLYGALRLRGWQLRWGATDEEQSIPLPGDDIVARPDHVTTRAITIDASPEDIWPWLVQMGKGRGGLYSYDGLDIAFGVLDEPSVDRVIPEFQCVRAGDVLPIGRDDCEKDDFYVHLADPFRAFVIGSNDPVYRQRVSWAMVLLPVEEARTRLVVRVRFMSDPGVPGLVKLAIMEPTSFFMLRKQMLTFKHLAERTHTERLKRRVLKGEGPSIAQEIASGDERSVRTPEIAG